MNIALTMDANTLQAIAFLALCCLIGFVLYLAATRL